MYQSIKKNNFIKKIKLITISSIAISSLALTACNNKKDEKSDSVVEEVSNEQQQNNGDVTQNPADLISDLHSQLAESDTAVKDTDHKESNNSAESIESVINGNNGMTETPIGNVSNTKGSQSVKNSPTRVAVDPMDAKASPAEKAAMAEALAMADSE